MATMTAEQAYAAMFSFLDKIYGRTKSNDLGDLLSSMSLLADGTPADQAVVREWNDAVRYAVGGGKAGQLELK